MSTKHLLDPELHPMTNVFPEGMTFTAEMLPSFRAMQAAAQVSGDAAAAKVSREEVFAAASDDHRVRCLLYCPESVNASRGAYLHIHGGGYILGAADDADAMNIALAAALDIVVLSVDYRLAPEAPIPAPLEDCYGGLAWLHEHAERLGVDRNRIAIGGESAGGGLAAALAILARDRGEYRICHQHLTYPMLDNRTGTPGHEGDPLVGEFVWTRDFNQFGWQSYLGDAAAVAPQVPARLERFEGLPPTWLLTAALDLFRDENIDYAQRLLKAGVATELVLYPGACHGFQMVTDAALSKRYLRDHRAALGRALSANPPH
ncbi:MAG: alpha/beta hydrolase [Pseudomonadota bacterium]